MKLTSFLKEEKLSGLDISEFTEGLSSEQVSTITQLLKRFDSFTKITLNDISEDDMFLHVSDGLVDIDFTFDKTEEVGTLAAGVEIASMVNHELIFQAEKLSEHETHKYSLTQIFSREFDLSRKDALLAHADWVIDVTKKFNDWYFDLSAEYGKIKLMKTTFEIEDGSSNNDWKWVPVGGVFFAPGKTGTIRAEVL
jgi:hypothetical protein